MEAVAAANTLHAIAEQAMHLSPAERAELSELLLERVHSPAEPIPALHADWHAEIERRIAEIDAGKVKFVSADDAMRSSRAQVLRQLAADVRKLSTGRPQTPSEDLLREGRDKR